MSNIQIQRKAITLVLLLLFILLSSTVQADPRTGPVTPTNSIIGANPNDQIGSGGVVELPSGNVVISSPNWNSNRGAVTCLTPEEYRAGGIVVSTANSLVGSTAGDKVGGIVVLENGNYVVSSSSWDNGSAIDTGAVTWVNGTTCVPAGESTRNAVVGVNNSLIGTQGVVALTNGNYVVVSSKWNASGIAMAGAVTWGNGSTGITGEISAANSLVGTAANDQIGSGGVTALTNGNYVVKSPLWNNAGVSDVGAVTWGNGNGGTVGVVSAINSLIGSTKDDGKNYLRVTPLVNGHYVVQWDRWDSGLTPDVGAVTWGNGNGGTVGAVSTANSLVGSNADDRVNLTAGTYDYQLFSKQVTLTRPVKSLKVKIEAHKAKGTFFLDDVAVVEVEPESLAVSVPAVPDLRGMD